MTTKKHSSKPDSKNDIQFTKVPYVPSDWLSSNPNSFTVADPKKATEFVIDTQASKNLYTGVLPIYTYKSPLETLFARHAEDIIELFGDNSTTEEQKLSNIHEPIAEQQKQIRELKMAVYELKLNDERKDMQIQELRAKLERRKKGSKTTKRKSKPSQFVKIRKELDQVKKTLSKYEPEWRFTKDMHVEEAKDTTEE